MQFYESDGVCAIDLLETGLQEGQRGICKEESAGPSGDFRGCTQRSGKFLDFSSHLSQSWTIVSCSRDGGNCFSWSAMFVLIVC